MAFSMFINTEKVSDKRDFTGTFILADGHHGKDGPGRVGVCEEARNRLEKV
jgi:hypothetical protein